MSEHEIRILIIDDDEDDYLIVKSFLLEIPNRNIILDWASSYEDGKKAILEKDYDACLLDYRLGEYDGIYLLKNISEKSSQMPIIFLTGQGDYNVDLQAMKSGAADYLLKDQINAPLLERTLRYAMERKKTEQELREYQKQLKNLSSQLLTAQEKERKIIAQELHDSIGQTLGAIKFAIENSISEIKEGKKQKILSSLENVIGIIKYAIEEFRRLYKSLRPPTLDELGILATLDWFFEEFNKIYLNIKISKRINMTESKIPDSLKTVIYRITQETFNNVAKHGQASRITFMLTNTRGNILLKIGDNGIGIEPEQIKTSFSKGFGLAGMKERTELSGGQFIIESEKDKGTTITSVWDLNKIAAYLD